ncbi:hypothetical protein [Haloarchaeobius sp. HRN-SO-5]|uniref:hypothetical protein n=1 Tax=Haloarchaeobius sp. HRN-SO-5 TaxID=3446118 RepID=UPI003EBFA222
MSLWSWLADFLDFEDGESPTHGAVRNQTYVVAAQAESDGEVAASASNVSPVYDYIAAPQGGATGVPSGSTVVDFANGVIRTSQMQDPVAEFRSLDDVDGAERLRSASLFVDVPAQIRIDSGDPFEVESGLHAIEASKFTRLSLSTDAPARLAVVASTRAQPLATANGAFQRLAEYPVPTGFNSYTELKFTTPETAEREGNPMTHAEPVIPLDGREATITVENTSGNGNAIDAEVQARTATGEPFETFAEATDIADGDHHVFNIQQTYLTALRVRFKNTGTDLNVAAAAQFRGEDR